MKNMNWFFNDYLSYQNFLLERSVLQHGLMNAKISLRSLILTVTMLPCSLITAPELMIVRSDFDLLKIDLEDKSYSSN